MQITIDIPDERVAQLFQTVAESRDPVTRGWLDNMQLIAGRSAKARWWEDETLFCNTGLQIVVVEQDDETKKRHLIGLRKIRVGLTKMATRYPYIFEQVIKDNIDQSCADIFLQCVVFGEEKYA